MTTLKIGDKQVKVDDSFLSLPKDQQQAMVNKIAAQIDAGHSDSASAAAAAPPVTAPAGLVPGSREYADWAASQARADRTLPQVSDPSKMDWAPPDVMPAPLRAWSTHTVESIPILGAMAQKAMKGSDAPAPRNLSSLITGEAPVNIPTADQQYRRAIDRAAERQAPGYATAGDITGSVLPYVAASQVPGLATILGMDAAAPLAANMILGGASQKLISMADESARGAPPEQANADSNIAAAVGAVSPVVGKVVSKGIEAAAKPVSKFVGSIFNPEGTADKIIANSIRTDANLGPGLTPADEAIAAANSQPLINADRFGPNTRDLARTASNLDPAARQTMNEAVSDRFLTQNQRAVDWIQRNTGAPTNVHALGEQITDTARKANKPAYLKAYSDPRAAGVLMVPADPANPGAGDMLSPEIHQLMGAGPVQKAIKGATESAKIDSALNGYGPVENPFKFNKDGTYDWVPGAKAPSLQFWDHVQRNLGRAAKIAGRQGDSQAGSIWALRGKLNDALDTAVPAFGVARSGAARKFGAEDALEAGQKFIGADASELPALQAAHNQFSPAEKKLFASGFASSLIDKVQKAPDTTNVINTVFGSPRAKAQVELALGSKAAADLEHFLRIENIQHLTKQVVQGGSNTVAQSAAAAAIGYGTGVGSSGGNFNPLGWSPDTWAKAGGVAGLLRFGKAGAKALGIDADKRVMQSIATSLASNDPTVIARATAMASRSPKSAAAIKAIEQGLSLAARAAAPPLAITVQGGAQQETMH